jgi:hypothetical protein
MDYLVENLKLHFPYTCKIQKDYKTYSFDLDNYYLEVVLSNNDSYAYILNDNIEAKWFKFSFDNIDQFNDFLYSKWSPKCLKKAFIKSKL